MAGETQFRSCTDYGQTYFSYCAVAVDADGVGIAYENCVEMCKDGQEYIGRM
jgi:hypothetical protein